MNNYLVVKISPLSAAISLLHLHLRQGLSPASIQLTPDHKREELQDASEATTKDYVLQFF